MPKVGNNSTERAGVYRCRLRLSKLGLAFREQEVSDFGIDAHGELLAEEDATGSLLGLQIKTGPSFFERTSEKGWWFAFDADHALYWLSHALPVLVVLCDLETETAYW